MRREWEESIKQGKHNRNELKVSMDESAAGIDVEEELKHEENSKSFNETAD